MSSWTLIVDLVRALVFSAAHLCGNSLGSGILVVSLLARLALLPLTLRAARRMLAYQDRIAALAPDLERIRRRHGADRARVGEATMELYKQHDLPLTPPGVLGGLLVQMPLGAALYQAISGGLNSSTSFLWISNLARPDAPLAALAAVLAGVASATGMSTAAKTNIVVSAVLTFVLAWRMSASVGLYWLASNSVGAVQGLLLRRSRVPRA